MLSYGWLFQKLLKRSPAEKDTYYGALVLDYASPGYDAACRTWAERAEAACTGLSPDRAALGCTGTALAESLRRAQMECEYADPRYVVLMFTPENPPQDYTRLQTALEQLLAAVPAGVNISTT